MLESIEQLRNVLSELGENGANPRLVESIRKPLETLRIRSADLGLPEVESASTGLQRYLAIAGETGSVDSMMVFHFALSTLIDAMANGDKEQIAAGFQAGDVLAMLDLPEGTNAAAAPADRPAPPPTDSPEPPTGEPSCGPNGDLDLSRLQKVVGELGGTVALDPGQAFILSFPATKENLRRIEAHFFPLDVELEITPQLEEQGERAREMLNKIKEFMQAMAAANLQKGQKILSEIAEQKYQAELYQEIGTMARGLHNSLEGFLNNLDPALKEMAEDKIPDSGSRLEHILTVTENAANTTLDNVEKMQQDNQRDQENLAKLDELVQQLRAIGEPAHRRLTDCAQMIQQMQESARQTHDRLITILTAQDFQDLTGQVILKIINLLHDLEQKLVDIISTFGVKMDGQAKPVTKDELYGPAHADTAGALGSQNDVDALLAEFGF